MVSFNAGYRRRRKFKPRRKRSSNFKKAVKKITREVEWKDKECHYLDSYLQNYDVTTTCYSLFLNGIATGSTINTRIANRIKMLYLDFNLVTTTSAAYGNYRCIIVYDRQSNGAAPTVADIYYGSGANPDTFIYPAPYNVTTKHRYRILYDKHVQQWKNNANPLSGPYNQFMQKRIKLNLPVDYTGSSTSIASIGKGALYALLICDNVVNPSNTYVQARLCFKDDD